MISIRSVVHGGSETFSTVKINEILGLVVRWYIMAEKLCSLQESNNNF